MIPPEMTSYDQELEHRFKYHPPRDEAAVKAHEKIRALCGDLAANVQMLAPRGREQSLAITKIEEAMMWANAAIARGPANPNQAGRPA